MTPDEFQEWVDFDEVEQEPARVQMYLLAQLCWLTAVAHLQEGRTHDIDKALKIAATQARGAGGVMPGLPEKRKRRRKRAEVETIGGLPADMVAQWTAMGVFAKPEPPPKKVEPKVGEI